MTVRLAQLGNDGIQERDGADAEMALGRLQASIRGSGWKIDDVTRIIRRGSPEYLLVDTEAGSVLWIEVRPTVAEIRILAWLWDGRGDFFQQLMPLLFAGLRAAIVDYPRAAAAADNWWVLGNVPGEGDTNAERETDAQRIVENIRTGMTAANVTLEAGDQPGHRLIKARVADLLAVDV